MAARDEVQGILDRVANDSYTDADLWRLRGAVRVSGDRNTVQVGRYVVRLEHGRDIHIGDRTYYGASAAAIREVLRDVTTTDTVSFGRDGPSLVLQP